jgi:hypothetical protein
MTNVELVVLHYITAHPGTRRGTVVDALAYGDWEAGHRIRVTLDSLAIRGTIQQTGAGKRSLRYTVPKEPTNDPQRM